MKAVLPHLRLLTLPIDKLGQVSHYLSDSQIAYLAKMMMHVDENSAGSVSPGLNLSRLPRSRPKNKKLKLEFIAEDLIKNDCGLMGFGAQNIPPKEKILRLKFVAKQNLFFKGIELLSRANKSPEVDEFLSGDNEASSSR